MMDWEPTKGEKGRRRFLQNLAGLTGVGVLTATLSRAQEGSTTKELGIGVIGCGGRGTHLAHLTHQLGQKGAGVRVVGVCDIYRPRRERLAQQLGVKAYDDCKELVSDPQVDAVIIATPDRLHPFNALEAISAGKDVYCEKPLTHWAQFSLLKKLRREAKKRGTVFQVGTQFLSDSIWEQADELISAGVIGKPIHAQTGYFRLGDWGERGMPIDDPKAKPGPDLNWSAFLADAPKRPFSVSRFFQWRMYMDYAGGPCTDLYPHILTPLARALRLGPPKKVVALGGKHRYNNEREVPDTFDLLVEYPDGFQLAILGTIANEYGMETVIRGWDGSIIFTANGLTIIPQGGKGERKEVARIRHFSDEAHLMNFFQCVRDRQKPYSDLEMGYFVQVTLNMAMMSYLKGKAVTYDSVRDEMVL
ncbi:MAG: Gfo/Idh/MocA family oxidoreductase [Armatimonadetes bacterium]|nr:Gfo/Idh/MocA family oxidoreductase [Armatimonadota bacterium]MDW8121617.1 Gfo/Idh/MocA family oxidoreductase [Armatimonadota bacterium]